MANSKQTRAQQKRRYEQYQAKIAAREAARRRRQRIIALVAIIVVVLGFGALGVITLESKGTATPGPSNSPTPSATSSTTSPTPSSTATALPAPAPSLAENRTWNATITTNKGVITATLDGVAAPQAVASFITLAKKGFFNNTTCHRVVTSGIWVLQCGSPDGTGAGGPGYTFGPIENAPSDNNYPAGTLAMARTGNNANSMGSQFFFVYKNSPILSDTAGGYTVFGKITGGLAILEAIGAAGTSDGSSDGTPAQPVVINEVSVQ
jgi:peptidyl-prolyl cis-trans isomerase B (cyclophilin B)